MWTWASDTHVQAGARALLLVGVGLLFSRLVGGLLRRASEDHLSSHAQQLVVRLASYAVAGIFIVSAMHELGFQLHALLGAAGVLTVAVGFASQTSASNLVSGLFLIVEHPFAVDDVIKVGDTTGEVLAIDLLSVKLRTFDNLYVRIPNETLIKSQITNMTRFPIRRIDLQFGVAYREQLDRVHDVLFGVADRNPLSLEDPKPLFIVLGFGDSSINLQFSVWADRKNFLALRNSIQREIKEAFDHENIEIPFPQRTLSAGKDSPPLAIRIVDSGEQAASQ